MIRTIQVVGNGAHGNPDFRTGFGFGSVTVQVLDASGSALLWQALDVPLPGTPDRTITLAPNVDGVVGRVVVLLFTGHEADDCGGFSDLRVFAERAADPESRRGGQIVRPILATDTGRCRIAGRPPRAHRGALQTLQGCEEVCPVAVDR